MKLKKKQLVILTTHFGTNFSGGSTATCEIFSRLESQFSKITVVGTRLGNHPFGTLEFIQYRNWWDAVKIIKKIAREEVVFYGDFYNSFLYLLARVPFFFTYHDNWPEMRRFGLTNRLRSIFYTSIYIRVFRKASHVFSVSNFKAIFIRQHTDSVSVVRNGYSIKVMSDKPKSSNVLMVGNIDYRKYVKALAFFQYLEKRSEPTIQIDIYGSINDELLANELSKFNFVNVKGFHAHVPYSRYKFLLHTSLMENLPITFCEALHHRLPVVAFDVGGASEIVGDRQGILTPPYLLEDLYQAFVRMTNIEKSDSFQLKVPAEYSWDFCSKRYLEKLSSSINYS